MEMGELEDRRPGRRERPRFGSPSAALIVGSSGTAVAGGVLITSPKQIRDGVITGSELRSGAVTGDKVRARTLTGAQIKRGSLGRDVVAPDLDPSANLLSPGKTADGPGTLTLTRDATSTWRASDTSIIALRLGNASRTELPG